MCILVALEKHGFRVIIKHFFLGGKTVSQTMNKVDKYYGNSASSMPVVEEWFNEFHCGRAGRYDAVRSGRPVESTTPKTFEGVYDMVLPDRKLKLREIEEAIGVSHLE